MWKSPDSLNILYNSFSIFFLHKLNIPKFFRMYDLILYNRKKFWKIIIFLTLMRWFSVFPLLILKSEIWNVLRSRHRRRNTRGENWMLCKGQSKESVVFPIILWRFLVIYFDNYLYIFHKTKLQTVILRCWTDLNHNWFKSYNTKCNAGQKE